AWRARQLRPHMDDPRSIAALDVVERYTIGKATRDELADAGKAAESAWRDAAEAAWRAVDADSKTSKSFAAKAAESAFIASAANAALAVSGLICPVDAMTAEFLRIVGAPEEVQK
ncbi:MAG: hypothetical protein ACP5RV_12065, partial [Thiomonas sp.]